MSINSKIRTACTRWIVASLCLLFVAQSAFTQTTNIPESDELLNGLKIMFWQKPGASEVVVKLRIHSGSSFDLSGKSGEMALIGDILFPDPATVDYFTDQMGGKFNVTVTYDSITITMVGKTEELDNILEVLRQGILATELTPELVAKLRDARIKILRDSAVSPAAVADRAVATRLFGDFPYGRPVGGSPEDLARVDRADLMLARDRFLNSNNSTLAIVGAVNRSRTMRVLKQKFGAWRKSEQIVPSTFRAPKPPDTRPLIVSGPSPSAEIRLALRGVARSDQDFYAAAVLAKVAQDRWQTTAPELITKPVFARSESYVLPGIFTMGTTVGTQMVADSVGSAKKVIDSLITNPITVAELERAKREAIAEISSTVSRSENAPDAWLDMDTYRLKAFQDPITSVQSVSVTDVQRVAARLFKDAAIATVVVGDPVQLKPALQGRLQFEVLGEMPQPTASPKPPAKPGSASSPR
jgi:zinc protease